jgi:spore germination protein KB
LTKDNERKLPDSFFVALIIHVYIGWGFLYLIKLATVHLSHNAYWSLIIALIIISPAYWMLVQLSKAFPGRSISQIFQRVLGKTLGKVFALAYLLQIVYYQTIIFRDSQLMVYTYFFRRTPFILMTGVLIAGVLYISLRGVAAVGRLAMFMLLPPFFVILALQFIGFSNIDVQNLRPIFEGSLRDWSLAGTDMVSILLPGLGAAVCLPFLQGPNTMGKATVYSLGMVIPLFFFNLLGIIGVFGPFALTKLNWPNVEYYHVIDYPFLLLEQMGLFFLIAWYASVFVALCAGGAVVANEFHIIFPRIKRKWLSLLFGVLLWILVNLPIDIINSQSFFMRTQKWMAVPLLSYFFVTWLTYRLFSKK